MAEKNKRAKRSSMRLGLRKGRLEMWKIWAKALGEKASNDSKTADKVAIIRTLFIVLTIITEIHIIVNVWLTHGT